MLTMDGLVSTFRLVAFIAAFLGGLASARAGRGALYRMVEEVNARLPKDARYSYVWWNAWKVFRLKRDYRRLVPGGPLVREMARHRISLFVAWGVAAVAAIPQAKLILALPVLAVVALLLVFAWWLDRRSGGQE